MPATSQDVTDTLQAISFWQAFIYWLKLDFISFGGPAGEISMMQQELVEKRRWFTVHRFVHALNYTKVLPGFVALFKYQLGIVQVIAAGAAIGLVYSLLL